MSRIPKRYLVTLLCGLGFLFHYTAGQLQINEIRAKTTHHTSVELSSAQSFIHCGIAPESEDIVLEAPEEGPEQDSHDQTSFDNGDQHKLQFFTATSLGFRFQLYVPDIKPLSLVILHHSWKTHLL